MNCWQKDQAASATAEDYQGSETANQVSMLIQLNHN